MCEILAFICYHNVDKEDEVEGDRQRGHQHVIRGFEMMKQHTNDMGLFDGWMKTLEITLDGRGRMGSLVGAHDDLKKLGVLNTPDRHLMEYAVSRNRTPSRISQQRSRHVLFVRFSGIQYAPDQCYHQNSKGGFSANLSTQPIQCLWNGNSYLTQTSCPGL